MSSLNFDMLENQSFCCMSAIITFSFWIFSCRTSCLICITAQWDIKSPCLPVKMSSWILVPDNHGYTKSSDIGVKADSVRCLGGCWSDVSIWQKHISAHLLVTLSSTRPVLAICQQYLQTSLFPQEAAWQKNAVEKAQLLICGTWTDLFST